MALQTVRTPGHPARIARVPDAAPARIEAETAAETGVRPLGVGTAALHRMRRVHDLRGALSVGETGRDLPFVPQRYFVVFDVPSSELRGEHAHRACHQFLICLRGSCRVRLDDGARRVEVDLDRPEIGVSMPPMIWGRQYRYTPDALLLVLASHAYDPDDYIRTYEAFLQAVQNAGG